MTPDGKSQLLLRKKHTVGIFCSKLKFRKFMYVCLAYNAPTRCNAAPITVNNKLNIRASSQAVDRLLPSSSVLGPPR